MAMHTFKWPTPPPMPYYTEGTVIDIRTPYSLNLPPHLQHSHFLAHEECITQGRSIYVARLTVADWVQLILPEVTDFYKRGNHHMVMQ